MKKKIFVFAVLIIIIVVALVIYLNRTLILNKIKTEILKKIQTQIGRTVSIDKIDYKIFKGFVITNLQISSISPDETEPFLKVKEISFNPVLFPFILKKNIMIPSIYVNSLTVNLVRLEKNIWNFSDLIESVSSETKTESKFSFTILKIKISNSEINFQDKTLSKPFSEKLKNLNLIINPSLPNNLKFNLSLDIENKKNISKISIIGKINFPKKAIESSINVEDLIITDYLVYFNNLPFSIDNGILSAELTADFKDEKLHLEGTKSLSNLVIKKNKIQILTDLISDYKFSYDLKNIENPFSYEMKVNIFGLRLLGLKYLKELSDINGEFSVVPDRLICKDITGKIRTNIFKLSGSLKNFKNPRLDIKITSSLSISKLKDIFKERIDLEAVELDGNSDIKLTIRGPLQEPKAWDLEGEALISNAIINLNYLPEQISNIQAKITFDRTGVSWMNLSGNFKQETFICNGNLKDFLNPQIQLNLSSDPLNFETEFNIQDKILKITKLNGNYLNSQFDIKGDIDISKRENPLLNINSDIKIELKDLANLNIKLKEIIDKIKLSGLLNINADFNGRLKDYPNWRLILNGTSELLSIYGLKINDVNLNYIQENFSAANLQLTAKPYYGKLLMKCQTDFTNENIPFSSSIIINDVDISKLKNDTGLKDKEISGTLQLQAELKGLVRKIKNSLNGSGKLRIEKGNLWQLNLLKGLGKFLFIPEFDRIIFREASGDFLIAQGKVSTDNFMFESQEVNILCEGNLDFERNIDFTVTIQLAEGLMKDATDLKGLLKSVLAQSTNAVIIKLTGTLKNPKYKIIPLPVKVFKKAKEFIFEDVIEGVLEDIAK